MKNRSLLFACLSAVLLLSCGSPNSSRTNNQQASSQSNTFPAGSEFVYISSPLTNQVFGFHMDTNSGSLSPVPASPIAGPGGVRGRMFLSGDEHTLISVGEGEPSVKYSINATDGSLTRTQTIDFNDSQSQDFYVVAIDAGAQFMYGIKGFFTGNGTLSGVRVSDGSAIPGLGMSARRVVSHPDQNTLYLDRLAYDIDANSGSLSRSTTISDLPVIAGELTPNGLTFVTQDENQPASSTAITHIYRRSSLSAPFAEVSGSPINTPDPEVPGWYIDPAGKYIYLWDLVTQWFGYRLDTLQQVNSTAFPDFAIVDNTGKFGVQSDGVGGLRVEHYDSSTGMYGSTIGTYSIPPFSNVRFIVGGN